MVIKTSEYTGCTADDLEKYNVNELRSGPATEAGIRGRWGMLRDDLVREIVEHFTPKAVLVVEDDETDVEEATEEVVEAVDETEEVVDPVDETEPVIESDEVEDLNEEVLPEETADVEEATEEVVEAVDETSDERLSLDDALDEVEDID